MDVLIIENLEPEVVQWLSQRHPVRYAPELARDPVALKEALPDVLALVVPPSVAVDARMLHDAPSLRAVGRVSWGTENIDVDACARVGIEVIRSTTAGAIAEAEFIVGALIAMLRRIPVASSQGLLVGRELNGSTIGLVGMVPAARTLAQLLGAFNARVVGYDPAMHASDGIWPRWNIEPVSLKELMERSDGVCVQLAYYSRYRGLFGERFLPCCKPDQVLVSLGHSALFDENALAEALNSGRLAAAWFDSLEHGLMEPGRPLHNAVNLQVTPRLASTTRESRLRSAWVVAKRIDDLLSKQRANYSN
jgi:phosphoglycerate dehydrogenase-like enzyme